MADEEMKVFIPKTAEEYVLKELYEYKEKLESTQNTLETYKRKYNKLINELTALKDVIHRRAKPMFRLENKKDYYSNCWNDGYKFSLELRMPTFYCPDEEEEQERKDFEFLIQYTQVKEKEKEEEKPEEEEEEKEGGSDD